MEGYKKYIGFTKVKCVIINPDMEWILENFDDSIEEEPNYILEVKGRSGNRRVRIDAYLKDVKDNFFKHSIYLEEEEIVANSGANLFINQCGDSQWCKDESQLFDSFQKFEEIISWRDKSGKITEKWTYGSVPNEKLFITDKQFRKAIKGELELVNLIKGLKDISGKNPEESVLINLDKLFEGNFKSLDNLIDYEKDFNFIALLYVENQKQKVWKEFLPLKLASDINNNCNISKYNKKIFDKFVEGLSYCKGIYKLEKMRELKPSDIPEEKVIDETDSDY